MQHWKNILALSGVMLVGTFTLLSLSGCGGGGGSSAAGGTGSSATPAALNVFVTDAFTDQYKQVLVTLYKIELTTDGTNYQTVFSDASGQTINLSSLASTTDLLASVNVPAGTYTQARITFADHFTLVSQAGVSTSTAVDPSIGTVTNGMVALTIATPTKCLPGQASALVIDFNLAEFTLVGNVLRPQLGPGGGSQDAGKDCSAHLGGTVANLVAGTNFDLQGPDGRTLHVLLSSTTTTVSGQTGAAFTLANGQNVRVEGAFDITSQTVTATSVILNDDMAVPHQRVNGTVASVDTTANTFVLTVDHADGFQPTAGTIIVAVGTATDYPNGPNQTSGSFAKIVVGNAVGAEGTFDAATQTLTARSVFLGPAPPGDGGGPGGGGNPPGGNPQGPGNNPPGAPH